MTEETQGERIVRKIEETQAANEAKRKQLFTRTDLWDLEQKVDAALDVELEKLMEIEDVERRQIKARQGLYGRLIKANEWLSMMQRCVATEEPVIKLQSSVSVALWDARIL